MVAVCFTVGSVTDLAVSVIVSDFVRPLGGVYVT
jgi:hypothetical protein